MNLIKPERLHIDDTVSILSPSWGGPSLYPHIFDLGVGLLQRWGLHVKEFPTARMAAAELAAHPELRAADINNAFADPTVKAIIASIGGDDSVRILPYLDPDIIARNPKILMGYSDTTTLHVFCQLQGLVTFHGPSIMAGFAQMNTLPEYAVHVRQMLLTPAESHLYRPFERYCDGYPDWANVGRAGEVNELRPPEGWRLLQGSGVAEGRLFGGCIEVLEFLNGSKFWPPQQFWRDRLFFLETSEEAPDVETVREILRGYGRQGIWNEVSALLVGRAARYGDREKAALDEMLVATIGGEFGRSDLPIMSNMDFGHTDPQIVLPQGIMARLDCCAQTLTLIEPWLA